MTTLSNVNIIEATRLTREGRLAEAMALLQRGPVPSAAPAEEERDASKSSTGRASPMIDMAPPSSLGGAWTAQKFDMGHSAPGMPTGFAGGLTGTNVPGAMRGFLSRMGDLGSARGLDGIVGPIQAPPLPNGARFEERTCANAAGSRAYKLYVPSSYSGQAVPLVVMLHGCAQSPDDFAAGTRMNELAEEHNILVVYPAQSPSANPSKCWNWFSASDQKRDQGEASLIADITRQVMRDFAVEPGRVYVAGLSAGGAAAAIMASAYPDLYAAVCVHSGLACGAASDMPSAFAAMQQGSSPSARASHNGSRPPVPTIVFHGDGDKTVNPVNADQVIAQSKAAADFHTTVTRGRAPGGLAYTRTVQADGSGQPVLEQWVLHGAGHAWSGGSTSGSYTEPRGPDASREMLRFFLQQSAKASLT